MVDVAENSEFQVCVKLMNSSDSLQRTVPVMLAIDTEVGKFSVNCKYIHLN